MNRRTGVADNPVLIGAGTVIVLLVLVLLAYNANQGLPFVPSYVVKAEVPSGANLVVGNDVRVGGARIGLVAAITPRRQGDKVWAELTLKIDQKYAPLPDDSLVEVRPRSSIGLKYVQLTEGRSPRGVPDGGALPLANARRASEFDDLLNTFNKKVREGNRAVLDEFGNALAGRGLDLNAAFGELDPLLENFETVSRALSAPGTRFGRFFRVLGRAAAESADAGRAGGDVWRKMDTTFTALATVTGPIQETIVKSPPALATFTTAFPKQRPYIRKLRTLMVEFQPGAPYFEPVSSDYADIATGAPAGLRHLKRSTPRISQSFEHLGDFAREPIVPRGLQNLETFAAAVRDPLDFIAPSQTVCNYFGLFARNLASALADNSGVEGWLRFAAVATNNLNTEFGPAATQANAPNTVAALGDNNANYLHANPYPNTAAPGQSPLECEAGNEVTEPGSRIGGVTLSQSQTIGNAPGDQGSTTETTLPVHPEAVK